MPYVKIDFPVGWNTYNMFGYAIRLILSQSGLVDFTSFVRMFRDWLRQSGQNLRVSSKPLLQWLAEHPDELLAVGASHSGRPLYLLAVGRRPFYPNLVEIMAEVRSFSKNTVVSLIASPASGWQFDGWSGDYQGSQYSAQISVTMDRDRSIIATFIPVPTPIPQQMKLTTDVSPAGKGTITIAQI